MGRAMIRIEGPGTVEIADDAVVGEGCVFLCHERIEVHAGAVLGDGVVLVDFAHDHSDPEAPIRHQPLVTAPIVIGERAVIGHRAVIERGVTIPAGGRVPEQTVRR